LKIVALKGVEYLNVMLYSLYTKNLKKKGSRRSDVECYRRRTIKFAVAQIDTETATEWIR